jgi:hypothetical protein
MKVSKTVWEEGICGLRFEEQKARRIEPHPLFAKSKFPEVGA